MDVEKIRKVSKMSLQIKEEAEYYDVMRSISIMAIDGYRYVTRYEPLNDITVSRLKKKGFTISNNCKMVKW